MFSITLDCQYISWGEEEEEEEGVGGEQQQKGEGGGKEKRDKHWRKGRGVLKGGEVIMEGREEGEMGGLGGEREFLRP